MKQLVVLLRNEVERNLGDVTVTIQNVLKNNGVNLLGLVIKKNSDKESFSVAPTIYVNEYLIDINNGIISLEEAAQCIVARYTKEMANLQQTEFELTKEIILDNVELRLINFDQNKDLIKDIPYIPFLDLMAEYRVPMFFNGHNTSIRVTNELIKNYNISEKELKMSAWRNTEKKPVYFESIINTMREAGLREDALVLTNVDSGMYVLSNEQKLFGASFCMFPEILKAVANVIGGDFYIIPSSIHELIIVDNNFGINEEDIKAFIRQVNVTEVMPEEVLSDNLYFYDSFQQEISIC